MSAQSSCCSYISQRWVTIFVCFFTLLNAFSMRVCLNITITKMVVPSNKTIKFDNDSCFTMNEEIILENSTAVNEELYDWSEYTQGTILSSFYYSYIVSNLLAGELSIKLGGKHILGFSILSTAIFTLLTPVTVTWGGSTALIWLRIIMGFGGGVIYPALSSLMVHWIPEDERSKAGSIIYSGASIGTIFGTVMSGIILNQPDWNWSMVFYFFGLVGLLSFALNCVFCYNKPTENPFISDQEARYLKENLKISHDKLPLTPWGHILRSKPVWALIAISIGHDWGFLTIVSDMPKYMSSVLRFSIENNGYFSSLPYLAFLIVSNIGSFITDSYIASGSISIEQVRKIGATIGSLGPAIFLIAASYAGCDRILVVVLITIGTGLMGCCTFGFYINSMDLAPNYASSLMSLANTFSTLSGVFSPQLIGILTPNQTLSEWRVVFWIVFFVIVSTYLTYFVWGTSQVQEWNDPDFLTGKKTEKETDPKESIQLLTNK